MLFHETNQVLNVLPISAYDATSSYYVRGGYVDVSEYHHATYIITVNEFNSPLSFSVRKYWTADIINNKYAPAEVPGVQHEFRRFWRNTNTDNTADCHYTLHLRQGDSTANTWWGKSQHGETGLIRGQTIIIEIDNDTLGNNSSGYPYDAIQLRMYSGKNGPNIVGAVLVLSEPRFGGDISTTPQVRSGYLSSYSGRDGMLVA